MDAAAELGRNPVISRHQIQPEEYGDEQAGARRDCRTPVSRDQLLRRERGQGNIHFPCSANHEQDWQPYLVDPYSYYYVRPYIHTYIHRRYFQHAHFIPIVGVGEESRKLIGQL